MAYLKSVSRIGLRRWMLIALAAAALMAYSPSASASDISACASLLSTGSFTSVPQADPTCGAGTILAILDEPFSYTTTAGTTSGNVASAVYREAGGTLDFYFQIDNNVTSATALDRVSSTDFFGFDTSVALLSNGSTLPGPSFTDGSITPFYADSDATGSVIGFNFGPSAVTKIGPGQDSTVLIIATNAREYSYGNTTVSDGGAQILTGFAPTGSPVPEPATFGLIGGGLLLLLGYRRVKS